MCEWKLIFFSLTESGMILLQKWNGISPSRLDVNELFSSCIKYPENVSFPIYRDVEVLWKWFLSSEVPQFEVSRSLNGFSLSHTRNFFSILNRLCFLKEELVRVMNSGNCLSAF